MCVSEMDESDKSIYCVSNPIRVGLLFFRVSTAVLYRVGLQSYPSRIYRGSYPSRIYRGLRSPVLEMQMPFLGKSDEDMDSSVTKNVSTSIKNVT